MSERMAQLDRILALIHVLAESAEGLTLDEMAEHIGAARRTIERMRDVIALHFDLDEHMDDRKKRFRIRGSLRRFFTKPSAAEVAALQTELEARRKEGAPQAALLESLLTKIKSSLDDSERKRIEPDLEPLIQLQRIRTTPGPGVSTEPGVLAAVQGAIMAGCCIEFDYMPDGAHEFMWRRVIPFGLIHGPVTYLIAQFPGRDDDPVLFRLDRMSQVRTSEQTGAPPDDWSLDTWMAQSFGIWREDDHEILLRVLPPAVQKAATWRFHPQQVLERDGDCLIVRFRAGALREIADHLFTWGGSIVIEQPEELRQVMQERLKDAAASIRPFMT